jgi:hypothetical protein
MVGRSVRAPGCAKFLATTVCTSQPTIRQCGVFVSSDGVPTTFIPKLPCLGLFRGLTFATGIPFPTLKEGSCQKKISQRTKPEYAYQMQAHPSEPVIVISPLRPRQPRRARLLGTFLSQESKKAKSKTRQGAAATTDDEQCLRDGTGHLGSGDLRNHPWAAGH